MAKKITVAMNGWTTIGLWLVLANYVLVVSCSVCQENCNEIWTNGAPSNDTIFHNYHRNKPGDSIHIVNWQWTYQSVGQWSLYYKEWPTEEIRTGGYVLTMFKRQTLVKLDWKISNRILIWTGVYRRPLEYAWNATVCNSNLPVKFESKLNGWQFHLGNIRLTGNHGILQLNSSSLVSSEETEVTVFHRKKRDTNDLSEEQKKTVWNKVKGYFTEMFNQGDEDQRSWLRRIGDWVLGFLQRVLS